MNNEKQRSEQAGEIFCNALEIDSASDRDAYVEQACAGSETLRTAVAELLEAHVEAEALFQSGCPTQLSAEELTRSLANEPAFREATRVVVSEERELGQCIGPYRLIRKIGEGGGGNVYLAEQEHPVRRQVALKVLRLGTDTKRVIERFQAERQVLAIMEHPNIAHVLDAGETGEGLPYFVMELVHGTRITDYCDEQGLNIRQREVLFLQVCHAIQHAHQKGIIHRDIKPSNILITMHDDVPVPKVIDFGVAKAMGEEPIDDARVETVCEQFVGTPAYMSPEQAGRDGVDVDMRSDIYSLGVLLYELLVGKPPFEHKELLKAGLEEMLRTLREREPARPSLRLKSFSAEELAKTIHCRNVDLRWLNSVLSGDLDWIAMKALEKDRARRYQTVDGLAEDILHHLNHEPVKARPPSRRYRFKKLVRRNKGVFASVAVVGLALIAGFGTSSWLFVREREARRSEAVLRAEAEIRETITQAAVLLRHDRPKEADQLVGDSPVPIIKPSLEAADVFSQLGRWNVFQGRWPQAADRYLKLVQAYRVDNSDMSDEATRDLLRVAPVLIAAGELESYHRFVQETIERFSGTRNPVAAEQLIKISVIIPVDAATRQSLKPLADVVRLSIPQTRPLSENEEYLRAWRIFSMAWLEYRMGNDEQAVMWANASLLYAASSPTRTAMTRVILAMAYHRLGQSEAAHAEFELGRRMIETRLPDGLDSIREHGSDAAGLWYDWLNAYLLLNEAKELLQGATPAVD